ncbi:hypothetical protein BHE90_005181 [Fusarium euwallaceae]|uniref:Delta(24)-sterol reductase n=1 Tax=Fusarium euwallaceae TaxID=1147111 RepID=A0A430LX79_9HYPO|nr:hypothetical protein BHE90_005181 [Fusarium euwallaceae]
MDAHDAVVKGVAERVKYFHKRQEPFRLYHGSTNSTRQSNRRVDNTVDTSSLNHVLEVRTDSKTVLVEPNVPMDALVDATLKHGLVPLVVMEFPGITVGGGFSGTSGESSSFRYGAFDATVNSIEIVLADGTITHASKTERQDLFWGAASAFGTLGVVTLLEVQLKEAKKYVELKYRLAKGPAETVKIIREECKKFENDYVDGIVYSKDTTVVCVGRLVDDLPVRAKPMRFFRRQDPWFYLHVETVRDGLRLGMVTVVADYIPIKDYLFRYDRGGFWVAKYAFKYFLTPFNRLTRYVLDSLLRARVMYSAGHKSNLFDYYMVQDVGVPYRSVQEFQTWLDKEFKIYPLWICPLRIKRDEPDSGHGLHSDFSKPGAPDLLNYGIWGPLQGNRRDAIRHNRALEQKVQACGGKKWLYAHAYYTEDEFWTHYDRASYEALRAKYGATYLPSVYDKVKVDIEGTDKVMQSTVRTNWPFQGLRGVYKALTGGDYLLQKKSGETDAGKKQD